MKVDMFSLLNVYSGAADVTVRVELGQEYVEFLVSSVISKRNKEELDPDRQFTLLNAYIDFKGNAFREKLFRLYQQADDTIIHTLTQKDLRPFPYTIVHDILDIFDIADVFNYVKNIYGLKTPKNLKEEFDDLIEQDNRGSRIQTYLKDDYLELAALALVIKAIIGPLGHYAYMRSKDINTMHKEYILAYFLTSHPIFKSAPMQKLFGLTKKLVETPSLDSNEADSIRIIEKQIPRGEMPMFMFAVVIIQKVSIATLINDSEEKNIITRIYNYVNSKLRNNGGVEKSIRDKTAGGDQDDQGDRESVIEAYRVVSEISEGNICELNWCVSNVHMILEQMPISVDVVVPGKVTISKDVLIDALAFCRHFHNGDVDDQQIYILSFIFKDVIDPRGLEYITIDSVINLLAVGFSYLWSMGFKNLALILTSYVENTAAITMTINSSMNRSRLTPIIKEELDFYFPYKRQINATTSVNLVEETINDMANDIFVKRWLPTANEYYIQEVLGNNALNKILPPDLKVQLAEFIIAHEKLRG
jgi:hypothetical protein